MPLLPTGDLGNLTGNTWEYRAVSGQPDLSNDVRMPVKVMVGTVPRLVPSFSLLGAVSGRRNPKGRRYRFDVGATHYASLIITSIASFTLLP